jgi:hypothetical protein
LQWQRKKEQCRGELELELERYNERERDVRWGEYLDRGKYLSGEKYLKAGRGSSVASRHS